MSGHRVPIARMLIGAVAVLSCIVCAGCAASSASRDADDERESSMGGLQMTLLAQRGAGSHAFYEIQPDGTIGYGGGFKARDGETTWAGPMTAEEIAELRSLIEEHGWFDREPASTGEPADYVYQINLAGPDGRHRYKVIGDSPDMLPILDLLDRIARRRFDEYLQTFPKPSADR